MMIINVASAEWKSERAVAVIAATDRLPMNVTPVGRNGAAYRSITIIAKDNGRLVRTKAAKQRVASPRPTPFGPTDIH